MDLSFSRRNAFKPGVFDFATLLARISAAQAATPTARLQVLLDRRPNPVGNGNARIALFANPAATGSPAPGASFAAMFSPRQPK